MKKIEPAAYITYKGHLLHTKDPKVKEYDTPEPLYTRETLEAVVEATKRECMYTAKEWAMMHVEVDNAPHGVDDEILKYVSTYEVLENIVGE